jgi:glycine/D-amino acid oxidase-like deaminating enzyme
VTRSTQSLTFEHKTSPIGINYSTMSTVIIGGGIIGMSTAFYLTNESSPNQAEDVHVIDSSAALFSGASGYAGGFLAKDWFSPVLASLGALSFELHKQLAKEHDGAHQWGYMPSTAYSLDVRETLADKLQPGGADWLREGTSRAQVASKLEETVLTVSSDRPGWLTRQRGGSLEVISDDESVAQV